jgi:CheY-like chemotaxis protein
MTGMRRQFGLIAFFAALSFSSQAVAAPSDAQDTFQEGVSLLRKGDDAGALEKFTAVLAEDLSDDAAYELWKSTSQEVWMDMLVKSGQFELIAKRLISKADVGRSQQADDADAIRGLLREVQMDDVMKRARAIRTLAANHGEFAVQYMLGSLADQNAGDRRVLYMTALTDMGTDVVLPLIAALGSDDAYLRRNVALTLGYIGDPRAAAALTWLGSNDSDEGVQIAASEAAGKVGSNGDALASFLQLGDEYHHARSTVLSGSDYSDVVWSWTDGKLSSRAVPRFLYADELSKGAYYTAMMASPASAEARAGVVRAYVSQQAEIELRAAAGGDVTGLDTQVAESAIAVNTLGSDAAELALGWAVAQSDTVTGVGLIRLLGASATAPTPGLQAALASNDGAMKGEAAVALGQIALRTHGTPSAATVNQLGVAAGREIMSLAVVIDGDESRGSAIAGAMSNAGVLVNHWNSGASGLALLKRVPGVDVIVLADTLPDLTADQVLFELAGDERTANTPVMLISSSDAYGDRVAGTISGAGDVGAIMGAIEAGVDGDRARADQLAAGAAETLAGLSMAGSADLSSTVEALTGTLAHRTDNVTLPAMRVLGVTGGVAQLSALQVLLSAGDRSDAAREGAADAIANIASRMKLGGTEGLVESLRAVMSSDSSLSVRVAASRALSSLNLTADQRATAATSARVNVQN